MLESNTINDISLELNFLVSKYVEDEDLPKVDHLLEKGADPLHLCDNGETVLHKAYKTSGVELVSTMLPYVKTIDAPLESDLGWTALHLAVDIGDLEILSAVLKKRPDLDVLDKNQKTPLHLAIEKHSFEMTEALIKNGASLEWPDLGTSALHVALKNTSSTVMIELLLSHDQNFDVADSSGLTPLMAFLKHYTGTIYDAARLCRQFLEKGSDPNKRSIDGCTAIHYSIRDIVWIIRRRHIPILVHLLEYGADVNAQNSDGKTVLHILAKNCVHDEVAFYLFKHGYNIELRDKNNKTAFDILAESNDQYTDRAGMMAIIKYLAYHEFYKKFKFSESLINLISSDPYCKNYLEACRKELKQVVSSFNLPDVLSKNERQWAQLTRNSFYQELERKDFQMFRIYGEDYRMVYDIGRERRRAEDAAYYYLVRNVKLNSDCIWKIISLIHTEDLEVFEKLVSDRNILRY